MSQQKNATIIDSIQSEVAKEASPLMEFLVRNSKRILAVVLLIAVAAAAYGGWTVYHESKLEDAREELGLILLKPESAEKLAALKTFAESAPDEYKTGAYLAIASSAERAGDYVLAAEAWGEVVKSTDAPMHFVAQLGLASALKNQGKDEEALRMLEDMLTGAPADMSPVLNSAIIELAEKKGDWNRAVQACEAIINNTDLQIDKTSWRQRAAYLRQQAQVQNPEKTEG